MGLSKQEISEIEKLSPELCKKIMDIFTSVHYQVYDALSSALYHRCKEIKENPFNIVASVAPESDEEGNAVKSNARAEAETALKVINAIPGLADMVEKARQKLTPEEQVKVQKAGGAEEILEKLRNEGH